MYTPTYLYSDRLRSWLYQARQDSSISSEQVNAWANTLETELRQAVTRYDYSKHFGDLLDEWISSGDSPALPPAHVPGPDGYEDESQSGNTCGEEVQVYAPR